MSTFYLDLEGGNDANNGTSFANRWKTFTLGATAARIAPGDVIRVMGSPTATDMGQTATWTKGSQTVTLSAAVNATIEACEAAWTAATNVTTGSNSLSCEGANNMNFSTNGSFTTGKACYKATGTLNLSAYQQISFWIFNNTANLAASTLSVRLCTDTTGDVSVHTFPIPATVSNSQWVPVTIDLGSNMNSAIASIAIYADLAWTSKGTLFFDNIIACKAVSSADSLSLKSLIGKIHTQPWEVSTTYASNSIRRPTEANRNGFCYKVTAGGGGSSGGSEPTWPQEVGLTVTDGALTWTCLDLEEYYFPILSISGTTVKINRNLGSTNPKSNCGFYPGASETVEIFKREYIDLDIVGTTAAQSVTDSGTEGSNISFIGGWDRTNMSTRVEQTWMGCGTFRPYGSSSLFSSNLGYCTIDGLNAVNSILNGGWRMEWKNCAVLSARLGWSMATNSPGTSWNNCGLISASPGNGFFDAALGGVIGVANCITSNSGGLGNTGITIQGTFTNTTISNVRFSNVNCKQNNSGNGVYVNGPGPDIYFYRLNTEGNGSCGINSATDRAIRLCKSTLSDSTPVSVGNYLAVNSGVYSQDDGNVSGAHLISKGAGTIRSATDQRNTASGISWKFQPASTSYSGPYYPLELSVAKFAVAASALVTVTIYVRRDATNIKGRLRLKDGQINGASLNTYTDCNPSINTWTQYTLAFLPTEAGVVELHFQTWNSINGTEHLWIDDIAVSQA